MVSAGAFSVTIEVWTVVSTEGVGRVGVTVTTAVVGPTDVGSAPLTGTTEYGTSRFRMDRLRKPLFGSGVSAEGIG